MQHYLIINEISLGSLLQAVCVTAIGGSFEECLEWTLSTLTSQNKYGGVSVGTFVNFVCVTIGKIFERSYLSEESRQRAQTNRYGDKVIERIVI